MHRIAHSDTETPICMIAFNRDIVTKAMFNLYHDKMAGSHHVNTRALVCIDFVMQTLNVHALK